MRREMPPQKAPSENGREIVDLTDLPSSRIAEPQTKKKEKRKPKKITNAPATRDIVNLTSPTKQPPKSDKDTRHFSSDPSQINVTKPPDQLQDQPPSEHDSDESRPTTWKKRSTI